MKPLKISIRHPALAIYNGETMLSSIKESMMAEIWEVLEDIRTGERAINIPAKGEMMLSVRLGSGNHVLLRFCRPLPTEKDHGSDLSLVDIRWPDQVN